jgi:hypothetical protein
VTRIALVVTALPPSVPVQSASNRRSRSSPSLATHETDEQP